MTRSSPREGPLETLPTGYSLIEAAPLAGAPGTYTYAVPPGLSAGTEPGRRVIVPFGGRRHAAIVLGPGRNPGVAAIREIDSVLDDGPLIGPELLELARWAADYYLAPMSLALKAMLPPGSDAEETRTPVLSARGREALSSPSTPGALRQALRAIDLGEPQLLRPGTLKRIEKEGHVTLERTVTAGGEAPTIEIVVRLEAAETQRFTKAQATLALLWEQIAVGVGVPMERLAEANPRARELVQRLVKRGLARIDEEPRRGGIAQEARETAPELTEEQGAALGTLTALLNEARPKPVLLEGVTGSGKTEVYLRLIEAARAMGGGALVLVPEIALTPQLSRRFRARFGDAVAVLHSGLGDRDRRSEWHRIRRGEAPIVVGARSAVFAPLVRPKVVIVDEEHDSSFKQASGLRYHGRDMAVVRGTNAGAVVVLGSATPSLESIQNVVRGRYGVLHLRSRVDERPMPKVDIVDLRGREKQKPIIGVMPSNLLSGELVVAMRETLAKKEQSIVFLNRRGHSTALLCRDCGAVKKCGQCAVSMTWHERRRRLVCHYCGAREQAPDVCETCGSARLLLSGAGTEKLEEELAAAVPGARIARLDRDSTGTAARLEAVLGQFAKGEIDVLVGTQMVAKGHDFPGVTLVCVLLADAGLHQPDFRSAERTAQLLTQVAGRAGRGEKPGRVLVQTFAPDAPAVAAVIGHDYDTFARQELIEREAAGYPPFCRLCLIGIEGPREEEAGRIASVMALRLSEGGADVTVLGPAPAPLAMLRGKFRFQVLLKAQKPSQLRAALAKLRGGAPVPKSVRVSIDVDPSDLL